MSYKEQILNTDCIYCYNCCKCCQRTPTKQCCFSGWENHCEILISEYDTHDKNNNNFCCTCFCTLLFFAPKCIITFPCIPFTCYNYMRNKYNKTENNNYIC